MTTARGNSNLGRAGNRAQCSIRVPVSHRQPSLGAQGVWSATEIPTTTPLLPHRGFLAEAIFRLDCLHLHHNQASQQTKPMKPPTLPVV